jgi:hypothetical protein
VEWSAHGAYGGSASGGEGHWTSTSAYGTTAYHTTGYGTTAYHTTNYYGTTYYGGYHPPTTVNVYGSSCGNCGGWSTGGAAATGMAVGMVTGAAMATSAANANASNAYNAGYAAGNNNASSYNAGYVAGSSSANSYNAGYTAGAGSAATAPPAGGYPVGAIYATLPAGCMQPSGLGSTYYLCGNSWFKPAYGANGVYYRVVTAP